MVAGQTDEPRIAVIGLGLSGIIALKNLLELGCSVVGIDRNDNVGGLWVWKEDRSQTTVLKSTRANTSKSFSCFQDFPYPSDYPEYPSGEQVAEHIQRYANHFDLLRHCRFNTSLLALNRADDGVGWMLTLRHAGVTETRERFDKVLVATGPYARPFIPEIPGIDRFKGQLLHVQAYKRPDILAGQRVVVVGLSNSGCDTAVELADAGAKVYLSHRTGTRIVKRFDNGKPLDHSLTRRLTYIMNRFGRTFPTLRGKLLDKALEARMKKTFNLVPTWRLLPAPPDYNANAVFNENIIDRLSRGLVTSLPGISAIEEHSIETAEGKVTVDAIIFCTGYHFDYSVLGPQADPTNHPTPEWDANPHANRLPFPRLYQTLFHPSHPDSLAFIGPCQGYTFASFNHADLASQAIAQVWLGLYPLPSRDAIEKWCDDNYKQSLDRIRQWRVPKTGADNGLLEAWLNKAAGNGIEESLGWGWKAWKTWWKDRELYKLVMDGVNTPYVYRLFEGRPGSRQVWPGAKEAIYRANGKIPP